ncbi:MFS family permease [Actinoplanes octamycinicus]|uniref:MFS family permease n=1 Tax=Actinoplanes octamycinicus TaxID=135948 RepID=A0A7W7M4F4_9ACTN|nr:MFS transporter [Actinoplanes octamycinicus]MBB4736624.1 MFS family permease [Actinoplanes octamycinicus]GIE63170.1 MFS transporter [Actinoplanes octamycinicus]
MTGILADPEFRKLWGGLTVSKLGSSVAAVVTPLLAVQVLDADAFTVSLLTAAAWLPWLLIGLPAGAWVDRMAKRPVLLACDVVSALLVASVPVTAWLGHLTVAHLLAVALFTGVASVFFEVAHTGYLPAMFSAGDLVRANALTHGSDAATQIAGPALAGLLAAVTGAVAGLAVDAASFAASFLGLALIRRPERPVARPPRQHLTREISAGVRWLLHDRYLRNLMLNGMVANLALTGYTAIIVVFLVREVGVGTGTVGLLLSGSGLGGVAAAGAAPFLVGRFGAARAMLVCKVAAGVSSLLIPFAAPGAGLVAFVAGTALVSAFVVAGNVIVGSFRQAYVPPELLGRVLTAMQFVNYGMIPLGAVLGGVLATAYGNRPAVAVMTVTYALSGLIVAFGPFRARRDLPEPALAAG